MAGEISLEFARVALNKMKASCNEHAKNDGLASALLVFTPCLESDRPRPRGFPGGRHLCV